MSLESLQKSALVWGSSLQLFIQLPSSTSLAPTFLLSSAFPSLHSSPRVQVRATASLQSIPSPLNSQPPSPSSPAPFIYSQSLLNSQCNASLLTQLDTSSSSPLLCYISVGATQTMFFCLGQFWSSLHLSLAASSTTGLDIRRNSRFGIMAHWFDAWLWFSSQALWSSLAVPCSTCSSSTAWLQFHQHKMA